MNRNSSQKEITPGTGTSQDTALLGQWRKGSPVCWTCNEIGHVQHSVQRRKESRHMELLLLKKIWTIVGVRVPL